eukprot:TRINITY_DN7940_c0_g3_i1.p1 TRINITY_DN7940_c0_g3~~TRINITY_DN7940_c0_g3_i1.p1  ORF type:complete len:144 (+),score=24.90 TRINITY_DN7940_c0_g3_i1:177-608(+)
MARRFPLVLPLLLAAGLCLLRSFSFVPGVTGGSRSATTIRAATESKTETKKDVYKLPKPDSRLTTERSKVGQSFDQDKRTNVWAVEAPRRYKETEDEFPAPAFLLLLIIVTWGSIVYFAQMTGTDDRFGGVLGDDQRSIADVF